MSKLSILWQQPEVNPITRKARSIPFFNPFNAYGRVFFFSWFGFFIAFWSWYAFPPLLSDVIAGDIGASPTDVLNSNIIALTATLVVRLVAGPACDMFGPRIVFAGCLLIGAIPTFLAGAVFSVPQLYAVRFFVGVLGGSFVPCQVWTTGFYDKNIIGTANALTGGIGNGGGGVTYFVMPAIFDSLVRNQHLTKHVAWRVSFVVPGILIVAVALGLLLLCDDCPTGKWADRAQAAENNLRAHGASGAIVDIPGTVNADIKRSGSESDDQGIVREEKKLDQTRGTFADNEAQMGEEQMLDTARGEIVQKPSMMEILKVTVSPQTLVLGACYFCTFGAELAINSVLGKFFMAKFPTLTLQQAGNYAAMFGLMNVVFRPLGGVVSDIAYKYTHSLWAKKMLLHFYCLATGAVLVAFGVINPAGLYTNVLVIGLLLIFFIAGANGLNFSLVPHVHPYANGVVSGFTGAMGNFGGIVFAIVFRFTLNAKHTSDIPKSLMIIGAIILGLNVATMWIRPIPKGQIGGH